MYRLLDDALELEILNSKDPSRYLILDEHPSAPGHWLVQSLGKHFRFDLRDVIGPDCIVSPATIEAFYEAAEEADYEVTFGTPPEGILDAYTHLNDPPSITLASSFPDTVNGFLRFQVQGFNKLKDLDGGVAQWSTGTGKSVLAAGLTKYHEVNDNFDVCFHVVKAHNKINAARGLFKLAGIESIILDGTVAKREQVYLDLLDRRDRGEKVVLITNYEKFRDDFVEWNVPARFFDANGERIKDRKGKLIEPKADEYVPEIQPWILPILQGRLFIVWDEMPTKLKNRTNRLYRAVVKCLYRTNPPAVNWEKRRASELRQMMLSATPVENSPEDTYNCIRILDPRIYGTVSEFQAAYVAYYDHFDASKPKGWHNLHDMALKAAHIVHQVDKTHPDIASQFPEVVYDHRVLDWDPKDRRVYDKVAKELVKQVEDDEEGMNILAAITVMQMLCNIPSIVNDSAALRTAYEEALEAWEGEEDDRPKVQGAKGAMALLEALDGKELTNDTHTKIAELRQILLEEIPGEKVVLFTALNQSIMPTMELLLQEWGVSYVRYDGTMKQKQDAEDRFKSDPDVLVFLTSDKGSDSINLEVAPNVINFDGPMKWSTETQRNNRIHRVTSLFASIRVITLEMADSVDTRKRKLREKKRAYHEALYGGVIKDEAVSANTTRGDLAWLLGG